MAALEPDAKPWKMRRDPWSWLAAALVLAVYVGVVASLPRHTFWSPDEGAKFIQMRALHWEGGLRYSIPYRGHALDPGYEIYPSWCRYEDFYPHPLADGGIRFHWPIWFPLASAAFFHAFGMAGLYVLPVLAGVATCLLAGRLMALFAPRLAAAAILVTGLATPIGFYSVLFWEHTPATMLGLAAVVALASPAISAGRLVTALVLLCAATVLRMEMLGFAVAVLLAQMAVLALSGEGRRFAAALRRDRRLRGVLAVAAAALLLTAAVVAFGLPPRHSWMLRTFLQRLVESVAKLPYLPASLAQILINSEGHQGPVLPAFAPWFGLVAVFAAGLAPWLRARLQAPLTLVALALLLQLALLLERLPPYQSLHGVFAAAPFIVLSAYQVAATGWRGSPPHLLVSLVGAFYLLIGVAVLVVLLTDSAGVYQTGLEWGARNLLTLYPLGVVLSLAALRAYWQSRRPPLLRNLVLLLGVALVLVSCALEVRGVRMMRETRAQVVRWQQALPAAQPIVTDSWWLPLAMAPFYTEHVMHCVLDKRQLVAWSARARAQGVDGFVFASLQPIAPAAFTAAGLAVEPTASETTEGLYLLSLRLPPAP